MTPLAKARRALERDAAAYRRRRAAWREHLYGEAPRLAELDREMRRVFLDAVANPSPGSMEAAAVRSGELRRERAALLEMIGASADALEEAPLCPVCGDTGYAEHRPCECLLERCRAVQTDELSRMLDLQGQTFDSFDAALFSEAPDPVWGSSPRQNIELLYEHSLKFCRNFEIQTTNLLFSGPPGTGKTFLSACAAGALSQRGFSVTYDTAVHQLAQMEALQFGKGNDDAEQDVQRMRECDLLIIDDLGVEFLTPFAQSAIWDLVNTRLLSRKKMIISTNLTRDGIGARYSPALASRLQGGFLWLDFFGDDLRKRDI